jgi:chemotaxis methyl-accepting protein methylase
VNALCEVMLTEDEAYADLLRKIERQRHMPCASYKDRCVRRRIGVRMRANGLHTFADYSRLLDGHHEEWDKLMAALTINVTRFFRDTSAFAALEAQAYPLLRDTFDEPLRVWSAGCSHGHEPYSLAIGLAETLGLGRAAIDATDVDSESLLAAANGTFSEPALADVSEPRRTRWFSSAFPAQANAALRSAVTVSRHDLLRDEMPVSRYHLIACRNVIIYFSREAQQQLFSGLYNALVPGGLLFLGKVETLIGPTREMFDTINLRERIFQRPQA